MKDSLGDRMKGHYENRGRYKLTRRTPVIIRLDGRAFHTYTKELKPFDAKLSRSMLHAARKLFNDAQGAVVGYTQSDEISLLLCDYDRLETEAWLDYNVDKLCSISASVVTAHFNSVMDNHKLAYFDARAFNIPESEVANYFLWRAKDCYRNSVFTYARQHFSHKELHGLSTHYVLELLDDYGLNYEKLTAYKKYGIFLLRHGLKIVRPSFTNINAIIQGATRDETAGGNS